MKLLIRKHIEVFFIKIARVILANRNVQRSSVVNRRDNNDMSYMGEQLESIEKRMLNDYE